MKISMNKWALALSMPMLIITLMGCLKGDFDSPPSGSKDPSIPNDQIVTLTDVMTKYYTAGKYTSIDLDKYIKGVVVADDKSGNFYKTIIVEDENSDLGISVLIDENEIHSTYPVGRRVYLKLKGLTISDYNGLPQLGMGVDNSGSSPRIGYIPASLMNQVLIPGSFNLPVVPRKKKITELGANDINTLVQIDDVQFSSVGADKKYANNQVVPPVTLNLDLQDCAGNKIILRNSGYADFANEILPEKNGTITAIYSVFRTDKQLFIRNTSDVAFTKDRCNSIGTLISIKDLRARFTGTAQTIASGFVKGIVISDIANKNINAQNIVVQDGDAGIVLRFKAAVNIPMGTEVKVNLTGGELSEFSKLLQVQNLENTNVEIVSASNVVTPKTLTVAQIDVNIHESTLVKIENATLTGGTKFSDKIKVKDASGEIDLFTSATATFIGNTIKTGTVTVTAIVSEFTSGKQLNVRNLNDISGGTACDVATATADCDGDGVQNSLDCEPLNKDIFPGGTCNDGNETTLNDKYDGTCKCVGTTAAGPLDESFTSQTNNADILLAGWSNVAVKGTRKWQAKLFSNNVYAQATSFNDTSPEMETWLVTPEINTANTPTLTFESAKAFWVHDGLSAWVSTNYNGNPATATWTKLTGKIAGKDDADNTFIPSGNIDLKTFGAKVKVGFKYVGKAANETSTYRIDNVKVK
jgi:hypothetical protein